MSQVTHSRSQSASGLPSESSQAQTSSGSAYAQDDTLNVCVENNVSFLDNKQTDKLKFEALNQIVLLSLARTVFLPRSEAE